ncbi:MAG: nitrilase family protein [Muribaculaceae bacterium]|nr:nitrilase family protein [Muribaculaceae bacterium]
MTTTAHSPHELTVAVCPVDIAFGNVEANIAAARHAILDAHVKADIYVLPELFSTGYSNSPEAMHALASPDDGAAAAAVAEIARLTDAAVCGSFAAKDSDGRCYNRAFFTEPSGHTTTYDKRHLFSMSSEAQVFGQGHSRPPAVMFRGWRVAMCVCYDLRFPAWMRNTAATDTGALDYAYDIMLMPANWPSARAYALEHLLIARAIENQAPIVCGNRSGEDPYGRYDGCSYAFDWMGRPAFAPGTTCATFSLDSLLRDRSRFAAVRDADSFTFDNM